MTPFRVQCETCQSWLKVRQESLMGQIHACPKCQGMVHLLPADAPPPSERSKSITVAAMSAVAASDFDSVDDLGLDAPTPAETPEPATHEPVAPSQATLDPAAAETPPAESAPLDEMLQAGATQALGKTIALAVGGGGTLLVLAGALAYYLFSGDDSPQQVAATDPTHQAKTPPPASEPTAATQEIKALKPQPDEIVAAALPPTPDTETPATPAPELPPLPELIEPASEPAAPPAPAADPAPVQPAQPEDQPPKIDPLDYDPANLDLVLLKDPKKRNATPPQPSNEPSEDEDLDARLAAGAEQPAARVAKLDNRLADRARDQRVWVDRDATAFEPHEPVDLARRLSEKMPELLLPDAPLAYGVRLWSDLAGVPVSIEPAALRQAAVSTRTKMTLKGQNAELSTILADALKPLRLAYSENAGQLVVSRYGGQKQRTGNYDLRDLLTDDAPDAASVVELLKQFAFANPPEIAVNDTKIAFTAPSSTHFDLAVFCERLRRARGVPQRTKYPATMLPVRPALAELGPALDKSVTFSFVTPTPLSDVLEHWRRTSKIEILVDWTSMTDVKLGPRSLVRCSVRDQSWRDALDGILQPLGLSWWAVDGHTIQIGGLLQIQEATNCVEFYPLANPRDGQQAAGELTNHAAAWKSGLDIRFDQPSGSLIIRTAAGKQREVYGWLVEKGFVE